MISKDRAKRLWIRAQRLDEKSPFGAGVRATTRAIQHLGYVQIDTINVIERCHHHILFNRIPNYLRKDLHEAQSKSKTVFEYWTHALAYVPAEDFRFFMRKMKETKADPGSWFRSVKKEEIQKVLKLIKKDGALSIRDIEDEVLVKKDHPWASTKPSKRALQLAFHSGDLVIAERVGMLKKYELTDRHFEWKKKPKAATEREILEYQLDRALRSQAIVSLDSICHLVPSRKPMILKLIEARMKTKDLIEIKIEGLEKVRHWMRPELIDEKFESDQGLTHLLSPFDPLVIQRKRLQMFFDYNHRFEAYHPKEKRVFGYFALPVLKEGRMIAAIDLKTERAAKKLLIQKWTWIDKAKSAQNKLAIEESLNRFERFQLANE